MYFKHHLCCLLHFHCHKHPQTFVLPCCGLVSPLQFTTPNFLTFSSAVRASSCPPVPILTQLLDFDKLASILSESYRSELSGVMIWLLSGAVESFLVMTTQEILRQSLLPSASQPSAPNTQLHVSALLGGCPT